MCGLHLCAPPFVRPDPRPLLYILRPLRPLRNPRPFPAPPRAVGEEKDGDATEEVVPWPHPGLRRMDLSGCLCGDKAFGRLCGALQDMPVTQLLVSECGLTGRSREPLLRVLRAHREKRNEHHWSSTWVPLRAAAVLKGLSCTSGGLAQGLIGSPSLAPLRDCACGLHIWPCRAVACRRLRGVGALGQPLVCDAGLLVLDLSSNSVGDDVAKALAAFLPQDLWLLALRLHRCAITTAGATALLESLLSNETLLALDLRGNPCDGGLRVMLGACDVGCMWGWDACDDGVHVGCIGCELVMCACVKGNGQGG